MTNNKINIPNLYRGDSDSKCDRKLKANIKFRQLYTNLLNGGNPTDIYGDLLDLINTHINKGSEKSHFLSFSEDKNRAIDYGCNSLEIKNYDLDCNMPPDYDFVLITLDSKKVKFERYHDIKGIYIGKYAPTLKCYESLKSFDILLINILEYYTHNNTKIDISNCCRDKEWLVLPLTKILISNTNTIENTAIIDLGNEVFICEEIDSQPQQSPFIDFL